MFKHIVHLIFFAAGAGVGMWWGVNHPTQAPNIAGQEEIQASNLRAAAQAKIELLQRFISKDANQKNTAEYKQMLEDEKTKLQNPALRGK